MKPPRRKQRSQPLYRPLNKREIASIARLVRKLVSSTSNILLTFEELKKYFPALALKIVPDALLPNDDARAYPKLWMIKIRQGVFDGLMRGDVRGRWTLVHELGHVVLRHPKRPKRTRNSKLVRPAERAYEEEANSFAATFLAPYEDASQCENADEIAAKFNISASAAQLRFDELKREKRRQELAQSLGRPIHAFGIETGHASDVEDDVILAADEIAKTVRLAGDSKAGNGHFTAANKNLLAIGLQIAAGARLLLKAYESFRRKTEAHEYRGAATLAYSALCVQPVRSIEQDGLSSKVLQDTNMRCAISVALAKLGITRPHSNDLLMGRSNCVDAVHFRSSYLNELLHPVHGLIKDFNLVPNTTLLNEYGAYDERNDLCWADIHEIEHIMRFLMSVDKQTRLQPGPFQAAPDRAA